MLENEQIVKTITQKDGLSNNLILNNSLIILSSGKNEEPYVCSQHHHHIWSRRKPFQLGQPRRNGLRPFTNQPYAKWESSKYRYV